MNKFKKGDEIILVKRGALGWESTDWTKRCNLLENHIYTVTNITDSDKIRINLKGLYETYYFHPDHFELKTRTMNLTIDKDKVLKAAEKCSQAKEVLETLFPEAFIKDKHLLINETTLSLSSGNLLVNGKILIEPRNKRCSDYPEQGFYLSCNFNWQLIEKDGYKLLIPTKKD